VVATAWLPNKHSAQKSRCIDAAKPRQFSAAHPQVPFSHIATAFAPHHFGRAIWRGIHYERLLLAGLALVIAIGLQARPARAQSNTWNDFWTWINHGQDPRLTWVGIGVGGAATAAGYVMTKKHGNPPVRHVSVGTAYGVTTFGCMVVYPMVATVVLNRPLTPREAYIGMAEMRSALPRRLVRQCHIAARRLD